MEALEDKTVILVTHQVEFLSKVDRILVGLLSAKCFKNLIYQDVPWHYITRFASSPISQSTDVLSQKMSSIATHD
jgi:hypothetical protein